MPAKYSHIKKKSVSGLLRKSPNGIHVEVVKHNDQHHHKSHNPHIDRSISQAISAVSLLERTIARILLLRYQHDIARLFSTHLHNVTLVHLPTLMLRCINVAGPGWVAFNVDCDEIKDFFRAAIGMDLRQAGDRVATKSVLWSYTALRHFALSNNVPICERRGLQSIRLLPYYPSLKAHLDVLEAMPQPSFAKPHHLPAPAEGLEALQDACDTQYGPDGPGLFPHGLAHDWRNKVRVGYERLTQSLWRVAREFDVRGYGVILHEKLTTKWCDCGCSTDHLGEVCERTVREEEEEHGVRSGKQREWDGRGSGIFGWETEEEEDIWKVDFDFSGSDPGSSQDVDNDLTIGELMDWRYLTAELEKESGNAAFRKGNFTQAIEHYEKAFEIEPELPHYQLNLAAAHLKLSHWIQAEEACTKALSQHRSEKGYFRRAKARSMMGRIEDAIKDLCAVLKIQPTNAEALAELMALQPPVPSELSSSPSSSSTASASQHAHDDADGMPTRRARPHVPQRKPPRPLPFARTPADECKLKVVLTPTTFEVPLEAPGCAQDRTGAKGKQKSAGKGKDPPGVVVDTQTETFLNPGWSRYIVRRVE